MIPLLCSKKLARTVPTNYILLGIFTLCEAILVGVLCSFYEPLTVLIAAVMTLGITLVLTVYALTAKVSFKELFAVLLVCLFAMIFTGILALIYGVGSHYGTLYFGLGVVVYGIYIIFDTKLLADGKYGISHEDYVFGALILYIDIIQLFIYILRIVGSKK
jgi:FtsH-binding integral membrane protein